MKESWDEYVRRKRKEFGVKESIRELKVMTGRYRTSIPLIEAPRGEKLFNLHKRSLPVGLDKIIMFYIPRDTAEKWHKKLTKLRETSNQSENCETKIYYEIVSVDAAPKERSVYFNNGKIVI